MNRVADSCQPGLHQVIPWVDTEVAMMQAVLPASRRPVHGDQHTHIHSFPPWSLQAVVPGGVIELHGGSPFQRMQGQLY